MEINKYNWKVTKVISRKIVKLVDLKESTSSNNENQSQDNEPKMKVISKKTFKKRKVLDVWYDKILIPDDLISDTIKYNCVINGKISSEDLFRSTTIDDLVPLFVLKLDIDPTDLEQSNNPKIEKIYSVSKRQGKFLTIRNIEDKEDCLEINSFVNTYSKLGILIISPNLIL